MTANHDDVRRPDQGPNRRKVLECMTWAGTGVLWTVAGGSTETPLLLFRPPARTFEPSNADARKNDHGLTAFCFSSAFSGSLWNLIVAWLSTRAAVMFCIEDLHQRNAAQQRFMKWDTSLPQLRMDALPRPGAHNRRMPAIADLEKSWNLSLAPGSH